MRYTLYVLSHLFHTKSIRKIKYTDEQTEADWVCSRSVNE